MTNSYIREQNINQNICNLTSSLLLIGHILTIFFQLVTNAIMWHVCLLVLVCWLGQLCHPLHDCWVNTLSVRKAHIVANKSHHQSTSITGCLSRRRQRSWQLKIVRKQNSVRQDHLSLSCLLCWLVWLSMYPNRNKLAVHWFSIALKSITSN